MDAGGRRAAPQALGGNAAHRRRAAAIVERKSKRHLCGSPSASMLAGGATGEAPRSALCGVCEGCSAKATYGMAWRAHRRPRGKPSGGNAATAALGFDAQTARHRSADHARQALGIEARRHTGSQWPRARRSTAAWVWTNASKLGGTGTFGQAHSARSPPNNNRAIVLCLDKFLIFLSEK